MAAAADAAQGMRVMGVMKKKANAGKPAVETQASIIGDTESTCVPELSPVERFLIKCFQRDRVDLMEGGNRFGAEAINPVLTSKEILANPEKLQKKSRDDEIDFARRILWQHDQSQRAIADGRADDAAMWGMRLGVTVERAMTRLKRLKQGRPPGSLLVRGEEQILEVIGEDLAAGKPGQPTAKEILDFQGIPIETSTLPKDLTRKARRRLNAK